MACQNKIITRKYENILFIDCFEEAQLIFFFKILTIYFFVNVTIKVIDFVAVYDMNIFFPIVRKRSGMEKYCIA